jgi:hypothetical protein
MTRPICTSTDISFFIQSINNYKLYTPSIMIVRLFWILIILANTFVLGFQVGCVSRPGQQQQTCHPMLVHMVRGGQLQDGNSDFKRFDKASRSAGSEDNLVELIRPLGLVLKEDEFRNVFVETVAPRGNAARTGKVCIM